MNNFIFIPEEKGRITADGIRKGTIHYKFNTSQYQGIVWSDRFKFFYDKLNKTPKENNIRDCIIVFTNGKVAIGLKADAPNIFSVFNSTKINEIRAICKKYRIKIDFDEEITLDLFGGRYLNEIPPEYLLHKIAKKFVKIMKKDKYFAKKVDKFFNSI